MADSPPSTAVLATFRYELSRTLRQPSSLFLVAQGALLLPVLGAVMNGHVIVASVLPMLCFTSFIGANLANGYSSDSKLYGLAPLVARGYSRRQIFWGRTSVRVGMVLLAFLLPTVLAASAGVTPSSAWTNVPSNDWGLRPSAPCHRLPSPGRFTG